MSTTSAQPRPNRARYLRKQSASLIGGAFTTVKPSGHARTAAAVIERFTGRITRFEQQDRGVHLVTIA